MPTAAFVAIDEEMTGISIPTLSNRRRAAQDHTPAQRYPELKRPPERYSIIQLGVALFHRRRIGNTTTAPLATDNDDEEEKRGTIGRGYGSVPDSFVANPSLFTVRRYNFYMFPAAGSSNPSFRNNDSTTTASSNATGNKDKTTFEVEEEEEREVVLNPATVSFLHQHNMSFDMWSRQGVPFATTTARAEYEVKAYVDKEQAAAAAAASSALGIPSTTDTTRRRVELRRHEDIEFHARAMASLREWLDSPIVVEEVPAENDPVGDAAAAAAIPLVDGSEDEGVVVEEGEEGAVGNNDVSQGNAATTGVSFLLPSCNSFLRRALYETLEKEYPSLEVEAAANQQIRVWRLNEAEKAIRHKRLRRESWEQLIGAKLGMWRVFEGLRRACCGLEINKRNVYFAESYESIDWTNMARGDELLEEEEQIHQNIPLVVHNGFLDLCFLLTHFHSSKLPENYQECKDLISFYFPVIYDTKVMATECLCWEGDTNNSNLNSQFTNLSNLFQTVACNALEPSGRSIVDEIQVVAAAGRSYNHNVEDQEHEAAFDAYMTGAIFLGLCKRVQRSISSSHHFLDVIANVDASEARQWYARNKIYHMSMFTMDLEDVRMNRDPLSRGMVPEYTYRVAGIDKAVATRDIVRCLAGLVDESNTPVNFEIIWIDDTTFLVAVSSRNAMVDMRILADEREKVLREHGSILLSALRNRFNKDETIVLLESHLSGLVTRNIGDRLFSKTNLSWIDWILSGFGLTRKLDAIEGAEGPSTKRRRLH